jgi:hypothetical protein
MERVTFYLTTRKGQEIAGIVEYDGENIQGEEDYVSLLFPREDTRPISKIMADAPKRFSGTYLRASYQANAVKRFVTLDDGRVIFIEGPGAGGGSATTVTERELSNMQVTEENKELYIKGRCKNMNGPEQELVYMWVKDVPAEHLQDLGDIVLVRNNDDGRDYGVSVTESGYLRRRYSREDSHTLGYYAPLGNHIILSERQDFTKETFIHEVGHHATEKIARANERILLAADTVARNFAEKFNASDVFDKFLLHQVAASAGLRLHTFTHPFEVLADAYMVRMLGDEVQNANLSMLWNKYTSIDISLEEIMK